MFSSLRGPATPSVRKDAQMAGSFSSLFAGVTEKLDKHVGWHRMPLPLGMLTLIGLRDRLRAKNLYDTGRGTHEVPEPADDRHLTARTIDGTFNDLRRSADGQLRQPVRPKRPASLYGRRVGGDDPRSEPARDQPGAPDPRRVPAGDDAQPARRGVDPVRGARLVQPRQGRSEEAVEGPARRRRPVARPSDDDPADAARSDVRSGRADDVHHG